MLLYIISHLLYTFIILSFLSNNKVRFILYDKFFYNVLIWSGYTDCEWKVFTTNGATRADRTLIK